MKLCIRDYPALIIPDKLLVPMQKPFNEHTPYVAKVAARWKSKNYLNKLVLKILCLEDLRNRMIELGGYSTYSDPMAGIGVSARIFGKGIGKRMRLSDLDEGCRKVLAANFKGRIGADDILTHHPFQSADLLFLDFNDFTYKRALDKYVFVIQKARETNSKFLVINDCSLFYFRYGRKSFEVYSRLLGVKIRSVEDYFRALVPKYAKVGFHLVQVAYFSETSFLLFAREPHPLKIINMAERPVPLGMISVEPSESLAA